MRREQSLVSPATTQTQHKICLQISAWCCHPPRPGTVDTLLNNTTQGSPANNFPEPQGPAMHARPASLHPTSHILHPASSHVLHLASHISCPASCIVPHPASAHVLHHRSSMAALLLNWRARLRLQQSFWSSCASVPERARSLQNVNPQGNSLQLPFPS